MHADWLPPRSAASLLSIIKLQLASEKTCGAQSLLFISFSSRLQSVSAFPHALSILIHHFPFFLSLCKVTVSPCFPVSLAVFCLQADSRDWWMWGWTDRRRAGSRQRVKNTLGWNINQATSLRIMMYKQLQIRVCCFLDVTAVTQSGQMPLTARNFSDSCNLLQIEPVLCHSFFFPVSTWDWMLITTTGKIKFDFLHFWSSFKVVCCKNELIMKEKDKKKWEAWVQLFYVGRFISWSLL